MVACLAPLAHQGPIPITQGPRSALFATQDDTAMNMGPHLKERALLVALVCPVPQEQQAAASASRAHMVLHPRAQIVNRASSQRSLPPHLSLTARSVNQLRLEKQPFQASAPRHVRPVPKAPLGTTK